MKPSKQKSINKIYSCHGRRCPKILCRCAETVDVGLPHAAGIINHAAQVGFSTLVSVQVRVAGCDQVCVFHCVIAGLHRKLKGEIPGLAH